MAHEERPYCIRDYNQKYGVKCCECDKYVAGRVLEVICFLNRCIMLVFVVFSVRALVVSPIPVRGWRDNGGMAMTETTIMSALVFALDLDGGFWGCCRMLAAISIKDTKK